MNSVENYEKFYLNLCDDQNSQDKYSAFIYYNLSEIFERVFAPNAQIELEDFNVKLIYGISAKESKNFINERKKNKIFYIEKDVEKKNRNNQKKKGRKKRTDKSERNHTKNSDDNIIRKIKVHIFKYAIEIMNNNIPKNYPKIKKLSYNEINVLQIQKNRAMFSKSLGEIFTEINMSPKFKDVKYKDDNNKKLIEKINKDAVKKEKLKKIKKILDLTFLDLLEIFKGNEEMINKLGDVKLLVDYGKKGYEQFINEQKKKQNVTDDYIKNLMNLINDYENWFDSEKSRKK